MPLNGAQVKQIEKALLDAFGSKSELEHMLRIQLDARAKQAAAGDTLSKVVFDLIQWSEKQSRELELIEGAYKQIPSNSSLRELRAAALSWSISPIERLRRFFNLKQDDSVIRLYLSRHSVVHSGPHFDILAGDRARSKALDTLHQLQESVSEAVGERITSSAVAPITTVSVLELIESIRMVNSFHTECGGAFLSVDSQKQLSESGIQFMVGVCPEPSQYLKLLSENGTVVFVGGPRANFGAFYYLYGEKVGEMRPLLWPKNCIKTIREPEKEFTCDDSHNLFLVQKHRVHDRKTIFYLAGTGVHGTVCAVAYLRKHWMTLLREFGSDDFCKVFEVDRRLEEDFVWYERKVWQDTDWSQRYPDESI